MTVELLNPDGLPKTDAYFQVGVATGTKIVHVSGQVARKPDGTPVGAGDLAAQAEQVYLNLDTALRAAGATFDDVVKLTVYVVDWTPDKMPQLFGGAVRAAEALGVSIAKPVTLLGVVALGEPDMLVEVEAVAVL